MEEEKVLSELEKESGVTILNEIEMNGNNYLVYAMEENEEADGVYVVKIIKDESGKEGLVPIEDVEERNLVFAAVKEFINDLD